MLIIGSSLQLVVIKKQFLFLMTGIGKGAFNIFVGFLMLVKSQSIPSWIMGIGMILVGILFIFLSKYKEMSDEDLNRAVSVNRAAVSQAVKQTAVDNKDVIYQAAYDNKDVIAEAAYNNREVIA